MELPEVNESFTADVSDYVAKIEEMIASTQALKDEIDTVTGAIDDLHASIDALPREITIVVTYVQEGDVPTDVERTVTQVTDVVGDTGEDVQDLTDQAKEAQEAMEDLGEEAEEAREQMEEFGDEAGNLGERLDEIHDSLDDLHDDLEETGEAAEEATESFDRLGQSGEYVFNSTQEMRAAAEEVVDEFLAASAAADAESDALRRLEEDAAAAAAATESFGTGLADSSGALKNNQASALSAEEAWATLGDALRRATEASGDTAAQVKILQQALQSMGPSADTSAEQMGILRDILQTLFTQDLPAFEGALARYNEQVVATADETRTAAAAGDSYAAAMAAQAAASDSMADAQQRAAENLTLANEALLLAGVEAMKLDATEAKLAGNTQIVASIMATAASAVANFSTASAVTAEDVTNLAARTLELAGTETRAASGAETLFAAFGSDVTVATNGLLGMTRAAEQAGDEAGISGLNMLSMAMAAKQAGDNIGGMTIPINAASFGITGLGTAIHLVFMAVVELLATLVPAMIAAAAGASVLVQGLSEVKTGLTSIYEVGESLGPSFGKTQGDMLGLGHSLQVAQNAADPMAYELLGEAIIGVDGATGTALPQIKGLNGNLATLNEQTGDVTHNANNATDKISTFGEMGTAVGQELEKFGANIDAGLNSNVKTLTSLLQDAVPDLVEWGQVFGNLGHAILNLAADMPGLAEIILKVIDGITQLVKWVSELNPTFIAVVMGFEEAYRWSGLLVGVMGLLGRAFSLLGTLGLPVIGKIGLNMGAMVSNALTGIGDMIANFGALTEKIALFGMGEAGAEEASAKLASSLTELKEAEEAAYMAGDVEAAESFAKMATEMTVAEGAMATFDGALTKMTTGLGAAADFMAGPMGAAVMLAVGAFVVITMWMGKARTATQQWITTINTAVSAASSLVVMNDIQSDLAQTDERLDQNLGSLNATMDIAASSTSRITNAQQAQNAVMASSPGLINPVTGGFSALGTQVANTSANITELSQEQQKLVGQSLNVASGAAAISKEYGVDYTTALGIATIAGVNLATSTVKFGQDATAAGIQVEGLVSGYAAMDQNGTTLANAMNAVNVEAGIQSSQISKVNTAFDSFISLSTSLTSSYSQVQLDLEQMGNVAQVTGSKITAFTTSASAGTTLSVQQIAASLKSFSGTSAQTWQAFDQSISGAETFTDDLRTAMITGVVSGGQYTKAVAGIVDELLPYAKQSATATSEVSALAQEAGGPATSSFSTLKSWVDKTGGSTENMTGFIDTATQKMSNMTTVAQNFAQTLQQDVVNAMAAAGANTKDITKLTDNYTTALQNNSSNSPAVTNAQKNLTKALQDYGFTAPQISQMESILTQSYVDNSDAAKDNNSKIGTLKSTLGDLGNSALITNQNVTQYAQDGLGVLMTNTDNATGKTKNASSALDPLFTGSTSNASTQVHSLNGLLHTMTGEQGTAGGAASNLANDHLGPLAKAVQNVNSWVGTTSRSLNNMPKSETTNVHVKGSGGASISSSIAGIAKAIISIAGFAGGGVVPGYSPGHDSVAAMLSPGEGVLIPQATRALGGASGIAAINRHYQHFADGGVALPDISGAASAIVHDGASIITQSFQTDLNEAAKQIASKTQAAENAAAAAMGSVGHLSASAQAVESLMVSMAAAEGWTGSQLQALLSVENREAGFNPNAKNPSSGAYGLAQFIDGPSEYAQYGGNVNTVSGQITAMFNYIKQRYGSPSGAWAHEVSAGWYDRGGMLAPGWTLALNNTGQPEKITPPTGDSGNGGMMHAEVHVDGKKLFDALTPYGYQQASRNLGNANANRYWAPGNSR